jgi:hypothetical protein
MNKLHKNCPKCDLKYSIEPSFYTGSMYVSYGVGVAIGVAVYMTLLIFGAAGNPLTIFLAILGALVLAFPYMGAVAKAIWAHMFIDYDKEIAQRVRAKSKT